MKLKTIIVAILSAVTAIILYKNNDESSFWLFGNIYTSKLILLCIFYVLGIITGALLFRGINKHPKEYMASNPSEQQESAQLIDITTNSTLTTEDKEFIRND